MRPKGKNSAAPEQHWTTSNPRIVADWEAAHIFLEVARSGSFRAAAQALDQSVNALRRKVDEFELALGAPLLTRHVNGVRLTQEGVNLYEAALEMEKASFGLLQAHDKSEKKIEGEVRLAATEGLGTFWIVPRLVAFQRTHPGLIIDLSCGMGFADVLRLEADLAIQLQRPQSSDMIVTKLGRMHLMFFASRAYVQRYGQPASLADFPKHRFVIQRSDNTQWQTLEDKFFPNMSPTGLLSLRNSSSIAQCWSIMNGAGIGILPTYAQVLGTNLVPLDIGITEPLDIWLTYHPDARRIARVRATIDWVVQSFDPRKFPWFRDQFIPPDRLLELYKGEPLATIGPTS
jgi:DNA-binding transcriptional LysR family regulator